MKTLLAFGVIHNREIHQMDMKGIFLNGELTKDMYRKKLDKINLVYKLKEMYMA
jgi:hypothetical protein